MFSYLPIAKAAIKPIAKIASKTESMEVSTIIPPLRPSGSTVYGKSVSGKKKEIRYFYEEIIQVK